LLDTLIKYTDSPNTILEIFDKSYGFQIATLHNTGLDFYKKNQINSIDFKIMSTLIDINFQSRIIDSKIDQLIDLIYSVPLDTSKKTKLIIISHLRLVLSMEKQMIKNCEDFIIEYVKNKNNAE
jgi:hypothetical protein